MSRTPQLLLAALVVAPWLTVSARDLLRADRLHRAHEATAKIGEIIAAVAIYHRADGAEGHRCPHPPELAGLSVGPTPPLSVECHRGPSGECRPVQGAPNSGAGVYPSSTWSKEQLWREIGFRLVDEHRFHYSLATRSAGELCVVEVEAQADLNGDGVHSSIRARAELGPTSAVIDPTWQLRSPLD